MTEREMLLNMFNRLGLDYNACFNDENAILISQGTCEAIYIEFDENGNVIYFE